MKIFSIVIVVTLLTACWGYRYPSLEDQWVAMEKRTREWGCFYDEGPDHRYTVRNRISFRAPLMHYDGDQVRYDRYNAGTWQLCPTKDKSGITINKRRDEAPNTRRQVVKVRHMDAEESTTVTLDPWAPECASDKTIGETVKARKRIPVRSLEDKFRVYRENVETENTCRRKILAGTLEDHWQAELELQTIEEMSKGRYVHDDGVAVHFNRFYKTREKQVYHLRKSFKDTIRTKRQRLSGLPDDTVVLKEVGGKACFQYDRYKRLNKPLGEYATATSGGVNHRRTYHCYLGGEFIVIRASMDIALGYAVDFDAFLRPVLDSVQWLDGE